MIKKQKKGDTLLDLTLAHTEEHARYVKTEGSLHCCDHRMVKFRTGRSKNKANTRITTFSFRTDFGLIRAEVGRILWKTILERRGA